MAGILAFFYIGEYRFFLHRLSVVKPYLYDSELANGSLNVVSAECLVAHIGLEMFS